MKKTIFFTLAACAVWLSSCCNRQVAVSDSGLERARFQAEVDGKPVDMYVLKNKSGMEVCLSNHGARILSILVPDKDGVMRDVTLGPDNIQAYIDAKTNMGATVGRYANRIGYGKATIDGVEYNFPINNNGHSLHAGGIGFYTQVFDARVKGNQEVDFSLVSPDGDAGFPGEFKLTVTYRLTDDNALEILYKGTTDKTTLVNLTNHAYFNLDGDPGKNNYNYLLWIDADRYTPTDSTLITTGELLPVEGTPMDFRTPTAIGARMFEEYPALTWGGGYDSNYVLNHPGDLSRMQASMESPSTGIVLEVYTDEPGLQFYAAGSLNGTLTDKSGVPLNAYSGACLETQKFPDTANKPEWPTSILKPGEEFTSVCIYKFGVRQ